MTGSRPDVEAIFHAARDIPDSDRRREYVREACGGDDTRVAHIEALLAAADAPDSLLDHPALGPAGDATRTGPKPADADVPLNLLEPSDKHGSLGRLGHYEVREVVGRGGVGVVLKAFDESLHRVVAIKVMAPQLATNATARGRFTREARAAAAVAHEHVVTIHAVAEASGLPYIVMQYVAGQSLQDRLNKSGPLPVAEVLRIGMQTAAGLAAAHAQGLVHRDVKPANILLENGVERVKLTDFGLARAADDASLTQSGQVAGTPLYMSPEQAEGKPLDARSDLFSLGSVLYAACAGRPPFRAPTSVAVLKRVCEETPTPVRAVNPEVPDWLADVITRLHAKDPAARFQTAAEVADLLGRHLAHLQHPSVIPLSAADKPAAAAPSALPAPLARRWAAAAAVLALVAAALATTEATGVTKLRATVVRILTPDGMLAVETDDPNVKVTVEGDGDLVIAGAGSQEVRLRPGSYRLHAVKDGKPVPLDRNLVTISRGDRQIVRVRLEGGAPAAAAPRAETGAFVVLGEGGRPERAFGTLAEAVVAADGAVIEIRGNGPFVTRPIKAGRSPLIIRAGAGYRPVVELASEDADAEALLHAEVPLTVEGLELRRTARREGKGWKGVIRAYQPLHLANCRFVTTRADVHLSTRCPADVRNCELLGPRWSQTAAGAFPRYAAAPWPGTHLSIRNSLLTVPVYAARTVGEPAGVLRLTRNTFLSSTPPVVFWLVARPGSDTFAGADWEAQVQRIEAWGNVFDAPAVVHFGQRAKVVAPAGRAERALAGVLGWSGGQNVYSATGVLTLGRADPWIDLPPPELPAGLAEWTKLWGAAEPGSLEGRVRYLGGDLLAKEEAARDTLTPEDFRLLPGSAGYRAGADGKDIGADVDLVGPGAAYERWKKTPDYQRWIKETKQAK